MSQTLGEKLRRAREERGISASEVAEQTRISPLYINAIDRDDYKPLPGGIFNKGFVKSYAKFVGMDEHEALQDYSKIISETEGHGPDELRTYKPEVLTDDNSASIVPTIIFAGIILALMTGGILFVVNYLQNQPDRPSVANTSNTNSAASGISPAPTPPPVFDQISLEIMALSEKMSVVSTVDGQKVTGDVVPGTPRSYSAKDSLSLSYYKGFASMVEFTLNGKKIESPPAPARGNSITVLITKENVRQIWESGSLAVTAENTLPTPEPMTGTITQTPRPSPTIATSNSAVPTPSPVRTPQPSPTPRTRSTIVVGNSSTNRP